VQSYVTCCVTLEIEKIMVRSRLWMIFGGFTHPIYSVYSRYFICFTVPLCSCITSLGSEQPLLFYLLYSFVPKKKTKKKGNSYILSTLLKRWIDKFIVLCIFIVMSCKVAPLNCLICHVIGCDNSKLMREMCVSNGEHKRENMEIPITSNLNLPV
jgi:hypothetical protein